MKAGEMTRWGITRDAGLWRVRVGLHADHKGVVQRLHTAGAHLILGEGIAITLADCDGLPPHEVWALEVGACKLACWPVDEAGWDAFWGMVIDHGAREGA